MASLRGARGIPATAVAPRRSTEEVEGALARRERRGEAEECGTSERDARLATRGMVF